MSQTFVFLLNLKLSVRLYVYMSLFSRFRYLYPTRCMLYYDTWQNCLWVTPLVACWRHRLWVVCVCESVRVCAWVREVLTYRGIMVWLFSCYYMDEHYTLFSVRYVSLCCRDESKVTEFTWERGKIIHSVFMFTSHRMLWIFFLLYLISRNHTKVSPY